ncbi:MULTISPECIES: hypothetical protein [Nitratireductor]|uniref:Uncharacterized protein n=2 Tax=Nitratireductor aquibiodomus TaxID=204799 RepID=A0A1H4J569_9HYPH|nr:MULTISPECIES: hypothetical protein [Nitratireductor]EIM76829.1 hypothetical protein A33O_04438 [Nitratireductor aquibiodomus RA22]SEB41444.1 hypothetical protein SAMN05216452_1017 [Nitratireductor aquibiodomus]
MSRVLFPLRDKVKPPVLILEKEAVDAISATAEMLQVPRQIVERTCRIFRPLTVDHGVKSAL